MVVVALHSKNEEVRDICFQIGGPTENQNWMKYIKDQLRLFAVILLLEYRLELRIWA